MTKAKVLTIRFGGRLEAQRAEGSVKASEEYGLIGLLSRCVDEMLADLGLPDCKVIVRVAGPKERTSRFLFGLELEDSACFGPLDKESSAVPGVNQLAELIAKTLFLRRDTLLAPAVGDGEWERVTPDLPTDWISRPAFNDLVAGAIRHGLNVPEAVNKLVALFNGGLRPEELPDQIEAILAVQAEPKIQVKVSDTSGFDEKALAEEVRDSLFFRTGVVFPPLEFEKDELGPKEFRLVINKLRTPVERLEIEMSAEPLVRLLQSQGAIFTTTTSVDSALGCLVKAFPMVVFNTVEEVGTASTLRLLRSLVDEGVDIRDLRTILGTRLETNGTLPAKYEQLAVFLPYEATFIHEVQIAGGKPDSDSYAGCVRVQLRDQISQDFADLNRVLRVVRLAEKWETRLSKLDTKPLSEDETFEILSATARAVEAAGHIGTVLLASSRNRRRLREVIRHEFQQVPVLCEAELSPYVRCQNAGEIGAVTSLSLKSGI